MDLKLFIGVVGVFAATVATANPLKDFSLESSARILAAHNEARAAVGAQPLQWDDALAQHAASYGPVLASMRRLEHSPRDGRPGERENLAMAWHGTMSPEQLVALWTNERRLLGSGSYLFPGTSLTGNWEDVAHYTQMVWPTTTHVGCTIYKADWDYLICRYSPPGNKDGKPIFTSAAVTPLSQEPQ